MYEIDCCTCRDCSGDVRDGGHTVEPRKRLLMALEGRVQKQRILSENEPPVLDVEKAQALAGVVGDIVEAERFYVGEVVVALLTVIGQQYAGRPLKGEELTEFVLEGADWCREWWK